MGVIGRLGEEVVTLEFWVVDMLDELVMDLEGVIFEVLDDVLMLELETDVFELVDDLLDICVLEVCCCSC